MAQGHKGEHMGAREIPGSQKHPARITVIRREIQKHWARLEEQVREKREEEKRFPARRPEQRKTERENIGCQDMHSSQSSLREE